MYACNLLSRYIVERKCQRHKLNHCHPLKWVRAEYIQQNFSNNLIQRIHVIKNTFWKMADVIKFCFLLCIHLLLSLAFELIWTTFMLFFTILLFYTTDCTFEKCLLRIVESLKLLKCLNKLPQANLIFLLEFAPLFTTSTWHSRYVSILSITKKILQWHRN